jgi:hypothetical protein
MEVAMAITQKHLDKVALFWPAVVAVALFGLSYLSLY